MLLPVSASGVEELPDPFDCAAGTAVEVVVAAAGVDDAEAVGVGVTVAEGWDMVGVGFAGVVDSVGGVCVGVAGIEDGASGTWHTVVPPCQAAMRSPVNTG